SALLRPYWPSSAGSWRLVLETQMSSASIRDRCPMPERAIASATQEPTPPSPTTATRAREKRATAPAPYRRSMPAKRSRSAISMRNSLPGMAACYRPAGSIQRRGRSMSTTPESTPRMSTPGPEDGPKKPSAAGRYFFMFLLGLALGVVAVVMLLRALEGRKTWQDRYPHAAMHLLSAHMAQLRGKIEANRCNPTDVLPHLQSIRSLGNDFEPAFPGLADDRRFV